MKSEYFQILIMSLLYNFIYFLSLVFATGYGIGIKLDDNQLIAYILIIATSLFCLFSIRIKNVKNRRIIVKALGIVISFFLILFFSGIVGSNEAMFVFVVPILGIPVFIFMYIFHYLTFNSAD